MNLTYHQGCILSPFLTYTPKQLAVLEFTLGIREPGEHVRTAYVACKVFGKYAETLEPHVKRGQVAECFGVLHQVSYEAKGKPRTDTTVTVKEMLLLDGAFETWADSKQQTLLLGGINDIHLSGNLTDDATVRQTKTGLVSNLRLATKDGDDTLYIDVRHWSRLELTKGQGVSVRARLLSDSYKKPDRTKVYTDYLEASQIKKLARLR